MAQRISCTAFPGREDTNGDATAYESLDTTGFHLALSNADSNGVFGTANLTDRQGNQYTGAFGPYQNCPKPQRNRIASPGGIAPIIDDAPMGDRYCSQSAFLSQVTDANGNQMTFRTPLNTNAGADTLGRSQPLESGTLVTDYSGCVSRLPINSALAYSYIGPGGLTQQTKMCTAVFPFQTAFNATHGSEPVIEAQNYSSNYNSTLGGYVSEQVVTVILADGSKWTFDYDNYLEVTSVGLPTGGSINLTWTTINFANCNPPDPTVMSRAVATRTVTDNNGHSSTWTYTWGTPSAGTLANLVTDPLNHDTVHTFSALDRNEGSGAGCGFYETQTQNYQGTGGARQLLKQVDTAYTSTLFSVPTSVVSAVGNVVPTSVKTTIYPSGKVSLMTKTYDTGLGTTNAPIFGNVLSEKVYDWGQGTPGALLREIDTSYVWQNDARYLAAHLLDLPASVVIKDGAGNRVAETDYFYDEPQYLTTSNITIQHGTTPGAVRGNLTTVSRWLNPGNSMISSHTNWYDTGEVYQQTDPLGNITTHSYDSFYAGAYSTKTQDALGHIVSGTYDFNSGLLTSFTNANAATQASGNTPGDSAHTTTYAYDFMARMTSATLPADASGNHPQSTFNYPDATTVERLHKITASLTDDVFTYYDGLGRTIQSKHVLPGGHNALVDTTYDGLDRAATVTNPYFSTSELTYGVTQSQYDAVGRVTQITRQDGGISSVSYSGNCTTTTDEAGKQRRTCSDALGRLTNVWEDPAGLNYETDYQYDALGNLLRADQKGSAPTDSTQWRTRLFTYDSLSRLLTANNPESGLISYFYDANGNLLQKVMPAANQMGTATHTLSYCYDALNRVTGKAYSWQNCQNGQLPPGTAAVTYSYDQNPNGIGRLTSVTDEAGSATYSYDLLGRLASESRTIGGVTKAMSYTYNLDGSVATMTYPSGAVINYTPDSAGRVLSVIDNGNPSTGTSGQAINYVTGLTYNAANAVTGSTYGQGSNFTGIVNSFSFNDRLQPVTLWSSSPDWTLMYLIYDFHLGNGDNGNVYGITNNRDISRSQAFTYDPLNRLLSAQNAGTDCTQKLPDGHTAYWGNSYVYDAWGNLNQKLVTKCSAENLSVTVSANNQLQGGYAYDVAGNMMRDNNGKNYVYDAENRIAGAVGFTYTYDADGNRVEKVNGTTGTLYWYMTPGIVAESDLLGNLQSEYVFFDGERVARKDIPENNVSYYFSDHLKTAALISDSVGNIQSESDYYPWGGELQFSNNDPNHYKFTGKERDAETGLDYFGARYYSNGLGRFVTPDWSATPVPVPYADLTDPQTLNQYSYVRNLPTSRYDKDGHCGDAITCGAEIGAGIGTLVEPGGGTAVGAGVGIAVGVVVDVGLAGYWVYKHFFSNSNKVPPPPPPVPQANANAQAPIPPGQQQHNEQNNNREQQKGSQEQARGRAQYENPGHHDAQSQNFIKGKTPLPKDAEAVYNSAIEDTNRAPGTSQTYYGRSANGQFYRYQGQNGKVHWNGTIKPNKVPSAIRTKLLGGQG